MQPLARQLVARGRRVAPNGRGGGQRGLRLRKRLDGQPAVVANFLQHFENALPIHVAGAGNAAIVFRNVHVAKFLGDGAQSLSGMPLLDVRMKGVKVDFHVGRAHVVHQAGGVFEGVEEVGLEAVERLDGKGTRRVFAREWRRHADL